MTAQKIELENHTWHIDIAPDHGAGILSLRGRVHGAWVPVMRETPPEAIESGQSSRFSSFTLAPYSNRIRGARFEHAGKIYPLRPTTREGNAQHGDVRARPWRPTRTGPHSVELRFDSRDFADINFPFSFTVLKTYRLDGDTLEERLELANAGSARMPAGFGLHPYFMRRLGLAADVALGFRAQGVYLTGPDLIPDGPMSTVPPELDYSTPRRVADQKLDHVFGGWDGRATLTWPGAHPGADLRLEIESTPVFSHIVVYTAPDGTLAVEPVTHATDGFNLLARGVPGTGVRELAPGEAMTGATRLRLSST